MTVDKHEADEILRRFAIAHSRAMINVACRYENDPRDIEEIVADAIELAHRNIVTLSAGTDAQVRSWLLRTVRYLCVNHVRRALARRQAFDRLCREPLPLVPSVEDEFDMVEQSAESEETSRRVTEVLECLPLAARTALIMDAVGATGPEIGAALGTSSGAARKRLQRAREAFRAAWPHDHPSREPARDSPDA